MKFTVTNKEDVEVIFHWIMEMRDSYGFSTLENCELTADKMCRDLHDKNLFCLHKGVLQEDSSNCMAGFVFHYTKYDSDLGWGVYLEEYYIAKSFRGNGHGRSMMESLKQFCVDNKLSFIVLIHHRISVFLTNLYDKFGFQKLDIELMEMYGREAVIELQNKFGEDQKNEDEFEIRMSQRRLCQGQVWEVRCSHGSVMLQTSYNSWLGHILHFTEVILPSVRSRTPVDTDGEAAWLGHLAVRFINASPASAPEFHGMWADVSDQTEPLFRQLGFVNISHSEQWTYTRLLLP